MKTRGEPSWLLTGAQTVERFHDNEARLRSWIVTRLGYFPFVLIRSAVFEAAALIQPDYEILNLSQVPRAAFRSSERKSLLKLT